MLVIRFVNFNGTTKSEYVKSNYSYKCTRGGVLKLTKTRTINRKVNSRLYLWRTLHGWLEFTDKSN